MGQVREPIMSALQSRITGAITASFTGNTHANSGVVDGIASTVGLFTGLPAVGGSVPAGAFIQTVDSASQVTLTQLAASDGTGVTLLSGFRTVNRRVKSWNQDLAQPALFLINADEERATREGFPPRRTMQVELLVYTDVGKNPDLAPGTTLNNFLDAIEAALQPTGSEILINRVTLGGLCQHCWIAGKAEFYPGDLGTQAKMLVPVSILIP